MAMTEAQKKAVPKRLRGVPGKSGTGSYPMQTAKQRGEAVALAAMHHGSDSAFTNRIRAKAARLGGGKKKGANHNGPRSHVGRNGLHYAAHEGHKAIANVKTRTLL